MTIRSERPVTPTIPEALGALATLPDHTPAAWAERTLRAMRLAQERYAFGICSGLAACLEALGDDPELFPLQREGLRLAQQLALMESDLEGAARWGTALSALHRRQSDPQRQREAPMEPFRQWRLEIGAIPEAARVARKCLRLPVGEGLPQLLEAVEREPGSTALAFALLLKLRRSGQLNIHLETPESPADPAIPARLWLLRRYAADNPDLEQRLERWRALHPHWEICWLDHPDAQVETLDPLPELVRQSCLCVLEPSIRGDLLRLAMLWLHGGVAVDWDLQPLASLNPLLQGAELLLVQDAFGSIGSALWAAPPRHPLVEEALQLACRYVLEGQGYSRWDLSGACLLSGVTARHLQPRLRGGQPWTGGIRLISCADLKGWLGHAAAQPAPEGLVQEPISNPLDRRRCAWVLKRFGGDFLRWMWTRTERA